ncbi:MAG: NUDIX hydrolase [Armatimonadota bacterium]
MGASVSVIAEDQAGRIAVVVRAKEPARGAWTLPGGFAEPEEDAESVGRREAAEEAGLRLGAMRFVGAWPNRYVYAGVAYPTLDLVFSALVVGTVHAGGRDEGELLWVDRADLDPARFAFASLAEAIRVWRGLPGAGAVSFSGHPSNG